MKATKIQITDKLSPTKWKEYREFKLARLKEDPQSSHVTFEEENNLKIELWEKDLEMALEQDKFIHVFALDKEKIVGMGSLFLSNKNNTKHVASVVSIHVDKKERKKGVGSQILEKIILEAKKKKLVKLELTVNTKQIAAINLYLKNGFEIVGKLKQTICIGDKFYDEYIMERFLF